MPKREEQMLRRFVLTSLVAAALAWPAVGQEKAAPKSGGPKKMAGSQMSSITATVEAIDSGKRELTLKGPDGKMVVLEVPEQVKRFNEIKVGDHLTFQYSEALVVEVHKADSSAKLGMSEEIGTERKPGAKPAGVISRQVKATVEVEAVDKKAPSITVRDSKGNSMAFRVQDAKNLEGVNPGDKLVITYNEAVAMSVSSPPAK
jgi:Cu/Ag efflux protein CusF